MDKFIWALQLVTPAEGQLPVVYILVSADVIPAELPVSETYDPPFNHCTTSFPELVLKLSTVPAISAQVQETV
ncbi:MAG: hypothetical protein BWY74_02721 [Firmicutes bacterium ADurb.Bin419]|nr:MAG: hypothetical protein BWY74_02721 [Firmicutes bacterium ADurb.Bin419]